MQFGGAAGTALFSTILSVAQTGAGEEGTPAFMRATAVGGAWTFAVMVAICVLSVACLALAFRLRGRASRSAH